MKAAVYCSAIAAGGVEEWDFAWSMYKNATIASKADKLRHALSESRGCSTGQFHWRCVSLTPGIWWWWSFCLHCFRYMKYCLDPEKICKQDAASTIDSVASNPTGQPLAWDFVRAKWDHIVNEWVLLLFPSVCASCWSCAGQLVEEYALVWKKIQMRDALVTQPVVIFLFLPTLKLQRWIVFLRKTYWWRDQTLLYRVWVQAGTVSFRVSFFFKFTLHS